MGCDIHTVAQRRDETGKWVNLDWHPFGWRDYRLYGWLAGIRNYSAVAPISAPRGLPEDFPSDMLSIDEHSPSWLSIDELAAVDYDQIIEDRRVTVGNNGGCTCEPNQGTRFPLWEFLGGQFIRDLNRMKAEGAERIVFWFDN